MVVRPKAKGEGEGQGDGGMPGGGGPRRAGAGGAPEVDLGGATVTVQPIGGGSADQQLVGDHMKGGMGLPEGVESAELGKLLTESGRVLERAEVAYSTYGRLAADGANAVLVGHSLTSNTNVHEWWAEMVGEGAGFALDPSRDYVVCVNYVASPYGSSSPVTADPAKLRKGLQGEAAAYAGDFPFPVSIRDNVRLQKRLLDRLGVKHLKLAIGGSMGGMLALEWGIMYPDFVSAMVLICSCGRHPDWAIGLGEAQRHAIYADEKWRGGHYSVDSPPAAGLATSRMMAMLSYRAPASVDDRFSRSVMKKPAGHNPLVHAASAPDVRQGNGGASAEEDENGKKFFAVESYLQYQGKKFITRFDANCYVHLTHTLDTHDVSRGRGEYAEVLGGIAIPTLIVGVDSDVLYPVKLQQELAELIPQAKLFEISSPHGHDSFLIEIDSLNEAVANWRATQLLPGPAPRKAVAAPRPGPAAGLAGVSLLVEYASARQEGGGAALRGMVAAGSAVFLHAAPSDAGEALAWAEQVGDDFFGRVIVASDQVPLGPFDGLVASTPYLVGHTHAKARRTFTFGAEASASGSTLASWAVWRTVLVDKTFWGKAKPAREAAPERVLPPVQREGPVARKTSAPWGMAVVVPANPAPNSISRAFGTPVPASSRGASFF